MKALRITFMLLSGCGFMVSAWAHGMALARVEMPNILLSLWLCIGIFVVCIPAMLFEQMRDRDRTARSFWDDCPVWLHPAVFVLFLYGAYNFFTTDMPPGWKGVRHPINTQSPPIVLQMESSIWMSFYALAFAMFYVCYRRSRKAGPHGGDSAAGGSYATHDTPAGDCNS